MNASVWRLLIPAVLAIPAAFAGPYTITSGYLYAGGADRNSRGFGRSIGYSFDVAPGMVLAGSNYDSASVRPSGVGDPEMTRAYHPTLTIDGETYAGFLDTGTLWFAKDQYSSMFTMSGRISVRAFGLPTGVSFSPVVDEDVAGSGTFSEVITSGVVTGVTFQFGGASAILTAVPEPGTFLLSGGLALLFLLRRGSRQPRAT